MFENIFESRNKTYLNLFKTSIYLSRMLRENVGILDINTLKNEVLFVSESENVIKANYNITKEKVNLLNIEVESVTDFLSEEKFNKKINEQISAFIDSTRVGKHSVIDTSFESILESFSSRIKLEEAKKKLFNKVELVKLHSLDKKIFEKFEEVSKSMKDVLKKNRKKIQENKDLIYSLRLANTISTSFNECKAVKLEDLKGKSKTFLKEDLSLPLFDLICIQEFVKKEILESRESLYSSWLTSQEVNNLILNLNENNEKFVTSLETVLKEYPFFALLNKKNISELIETYYNTNSIPLTKKSINELAKKVFDAKKGFKSQLLNLLQEKYGISLTHLRETPSLKNLSKLYQEICVQLNEILGDGVVGNFFLEISKELRGKSGIDLLDLNNLIHEIFVNSKVIETPLNENIMKYVNMGQIKKDLELIKLALQISNQQGDPTGMGGEEGIQPGDTNINPTEDPIGGERDQMAAQELGNEEEPVGDEGIGLGSEEAEGMSPEVPEGEVSKEEILATMKQLEKMIAKLGMTTDVYPEEEIAGEGEIDQLGADAEEGLPADQKTKPSFGKSKGKVKEEDESEEEEKEEYEE